MNYKIHLRYESKKWICALNQDFQNCLEFYQCGQSLDLNQLEDEALKIAAWLNNYDLIFNAYPAEVEFKSMFSSAGSIASDTGVHWLEISSVTIKGANKECGHIDKSGDLDIFWNDTAIDHSAWFVPAIIFFRGVFLFLSENERYQSLNADVALLFSAWQAYNALKCLWARKIKLEPHEKYIFNLLYKPLKTLLEDTRFDYASQKIVQMGAGESDVFIYARERLRTSMVLTDASVKTIRSFDYKKSMKTPLAFFKPNWNNLILLPFLEDDNGKALVRRLITTWLLPRYDYSTALHLASLLKKNKPLITFWLKDDEDKNSKDDGHNNKDKGPQSKSEELLMKKLPQRTFWQPRLFTGYALVWVILMGLVQYYINTYQVFNLQPFGVILYSALFFISGPLVLLLTANHWFDTISLAHLSLPRLISGVFLGYMAFVLQRDAIDLTYLLLAPRYVPLILMWGGALVLAGFYIFMDVLPRARTRIETLKRTGITLLLALMITFLIGLFLVSFSTNAFLACNKAPWSCFIGPFGWISLYQLLTLMPFALTTGLLTQFVFEDKTIPEPVWSSEDI